MVVYDEPGAIIFPVREGTAPLGVGPIVESEGVDAGVGGQVVAKVTDRANVDGPLGLLLQEMLEVVDDGGVVDSHPVRHGREQDGVGGIAGGSLLGVPRFQGFVPFVKGCMDLGRGTHKAEAGTRQVGEGTAAVQVSHTNFAST